ncbi:MAG: hypothetical protein B7Z63_02970 [Ignavibacteriae bacterium 37-53-5]|nr:MAG: hypothetical protein B7Z63_02970 [Ignavibacteriae bacterium 37-53-5]
MNSDKVSIDNFASNSTLPYAASANDRPDFIDFGACDHIINFGSQLTEISESPAYFSRAINEFKSKRNEFVTFSPKLTPSAYKASRWVPVLPEYYEDVALGLAYVILTDGTYDKDFVRKEFGDFDGFKKLVMEDYSPAAVESRTGVASKDIIATARKFANASAPVAYFDESILQSSNGTRNAYAVIALNALKGFAGYGKLKEQDLPEFAEWKKNAGPKQAWNKNMLAGDKDVKLLMIHRSNFLFNSPNSEALRKAISNIPMVVSFSPFLDETSELADLVIPDHDDLEKLDAFSSTVTGNPVISMQQPVVKPFYSTAHTGDVLVSLIGDLKPVVPETRLQARERDADEPEEADRFGEELASVRMADGLLLELRRVLGANPEVRRLVGSVSEDFGVQADAFADKRSAGREGRASIRNYRLDRRFA